MIRDEIAANKRKSILIIGLFIVVFVVLGYVFGALFIDPFIGIGIAVTVALVMTLVSLYSGDKILLKMTQAQEAKKPEHTYLINTVEGLAIAAGIPKPSVYVIKDSAINAFATGRSPQKAAITVTTGAIQRLNKQELEGVIAHEMSHIKNFDVRMMMLVVTLVGISVLMSDLILRSMFFQSFRGRDNRAGIFIFIIGLGLAILTPIVVQLIRLSLSRRREYLADASGALLTRYPPGLANALKKIRDDKEPLVEAANRAIAPLFIENPLRKFTTKRKSSLWSTHPDINDRIRRLEAM